MPSYVVFSNANPYSVSADIGGTTPFVKLGTGTTALTGLSTYNPSSVTVNAGLLTMGGTSTLDSGLYAGEIVNDSLLNYASSSTQTNSGTMSGVGFLIQSGSGTLVLSGSNAFSGTVTVDAGILNVQNPYALGATAVGTTVNAGGTLDLAGDISFPAEALNLYGTLSGQTGSNTYAGVVSVQANSIIDVAADSFLILTASTPNIGNNPFTKTGAGTLRLTADPNHRGVCTVAEGTLDLRGGGATDAEFIINPGATLMETTANLGDYRITDNGTLDFRVSDQIGGLDGSGIVTIGNTGSYTFQVGGGNQSGAFSGVMQDGTGKLSFQKNGTGTQTLTGVNTYTGTTLVANGTLLINAPGSLASNSAVTANNNTYLGGTGTINGPVNMIAGSTLFPGGLNAIGTLKMQNDSALGTIATGTTVTNATLELIGDITTPKEALTLYGSLSSQTGTNTYGGAVTVQTGASLDVAAGSLLILSEKIAGSAPFTKIGGGTLRLALDPNNTGTMTINDGVVEITSGTTDGDVVINSGATFLATAANVVNDAKTVTVNAGGFYELLQSDSISALHGAGLVTRSTAGTSTLTVGGNNNGSGNFSGVIQNGAGTLGLTKVGTGTQPLSGINTFSGNMSIAGTLLLTGTGQFGSGLYAGTIATTGTITLDHSGTNLLKFTSDLLVSGNDQAFGSGLVSLTGGSLGGAPGAWTVANTVNVQNDSVVMTEGTLILSGSVTNHAALTKTGAGTLLLNGTKTGTNVLTVSEGVLGGTGTIAGTVTNLATITAADTNSIGTLTVANLDMASNSTLFWNCNAVTQDVINVTGTLTLPAVATVIVSEETLGDIGLPPRVLFTFATGPAPTLLTGWQVIGAPQGTVVRVDSNWVVLYRPGGTMISIF